MRDGDAAAKTRSATGPPQIEYRSSPERVSLFHEAFHLEPSRLGSARRPADYRPYPPEGGAVDARERRQEQHAYSPPPISRHACGDRYHACDRESDGSCCRFVPVGRGAPDAVSSVEVTATDGSSVTIAWPASRDNDVAGYGVYVNGAQVGTQTPDQVKRWRDRDSLSYTVRGACLRHGLHGRGGCVRSWRSPLAGHLDDGLHLGLSGRGGPLGPVRDASGGGDGELGDAGLVSLVGQRRCGRVRALRVRSACRDLERGERDAHEPCLRDELPGRDRRGRRCRQPLGAGQLVSSAPPPARRATRPRRPRPG